MAPKSSRPQTGEARLPCSARFARFGRGLGHRRNRFRPSASTGAYCARNPLLLGNSQPARQNSSGWDGSPSISALAIGYILVAGEARL